MSIDTSSRMAAGGAPLMVRTILGSAWSLFKACLLVCLPLAVVGVAASALPGADSVANGEGHGFAHGGAWWALLVVCTLSTLVCYGAVLRQQVALAAGARASVPDSLRRAVADLPAVLVLLVLLTLPLLPAMLFTGWRGFGVVAALLTLAALAAQVYGIVAWPALVARGRSPVGALATSIGIVRGRWREFALLAAMLLAAILVFALLASILIGLVMMIAGQALPTAAGLAFSRCLMALVLALPVVYVGAVIATLWRAVSGAPASPAG